MKRILSALAFAFVIPINARAECEEKLAFVESALERDARANRIWRWSWTPVLAGGAGANTYFAVTSETERERANAAGTASLIVVPLGLTLFDVAPSTRALPAEADLCRKLSLYEARLEEAARWET